MPWNAIVDLRRRALCSSARDNSEPMITPGSAGMQIECTTTHAAAQVLFVLIDAHLRPGEEFHMAGPHPPEPPIRFTLRKILFLLARIICSSKECHSVCETLYCRFLTKNVKRVKQRE